MRAWLQSLSIDRLLTIAPIVGALAAASFDVGYFWGIDIYFYTFFSLSEHILFSLEAIPMAAMGILCAAALIAMTSEWSRRIRVIIWRRAKRSARDKANLPRGRNSGRTTIWLAVGFLTLALIFSIVTRDYMRRGQLPFRGLVALELVTVLGAATIQFLFRPSRRLRELLKISCLVAISIMVAAAVGCGAALADFYSADQYHVIKMKGVSEKAGRIVRAGDRGVLFVSKPDRRIFFIRWESIEDVVSSF